jgi:regulator of cell morphogenesis and NO signaling
MNVDARQTVRELALNIPSAPRVFEQLGIDYCCGGNRSLENACGEARIPLPRVIDALEAAAVSANRRQNTPRENGWSEAPLGDLIAQITNTHHKYTREEIARLGPLFEKVTSAHGASHPELLKIHQDFGALAQELTMHMRKEEQVLFPFIERMEEAVIAGQPVLPAPFGTVNNPVAMMIHEHDIAGNLLRSMRTLSNNYEAPDGACVSYRALYSALAEFERDLHLHIHLENNILFPRAVEMERAGRQPER